MSAVTLTQSQLIQKPYLTRSDIQNLLDFKNIRSVPAFLKRHEATAPKPIKLSKTDYRYKTADFLHFLDTLQA